MVAQNGHELGPANKIATSASELCEEVNTVEHRLMKILEYMGEAESNGSAREANIAFINAELMTLVVCFRQDLDALRTLIQDPKQRLEWLFPISEQIYKLAKQIDALTGTSLRLERERRRAPRRAGEMTKAGPQGTDSGPSARLSMPSEVQPPAATEYIAPRIKRKTLLRIRKSKGGPTASKAVNPAQ